METENGANIQICVRINKIGKNRIAGITMNKLDKFIRLARRGWVLMFDKDYEKLLESEFTITDRVYEYAFILRHLIGKPKGRIIDLGVVSGICYLPTVLTQMGFEYHGIDMRPFSLEWPGYIHHVCNVLKENLPFSDNSIDYAISVSTIEHVGIGAYGDAERDEQGDRLAIKEMARVLKPAGSLLVTVPFAAEYSVRPHQRTYNYERLKWLFDQPQLTLEEIEFWKLAPRQNGNIFTRISTEEANSTKNEKGDATLVIAMVKAKKVSQ